MTKNGTTSNGATELTSNGEGVTAPLSILNIAKDFNPRDDASPTKDLVDSVKNLGILSPIHIRNDEKRPGKLIVVDGHRRLAAAKKARLKTVPVVPLGDMSDDDAMMLSIITNNTRENLSDLELAKAFKKLTDAGNDVKDMAQALGVSARTIKETMRIIEDGAAEIQKGAAAKDKKERIPTRVAARASTLSKAEQKKLAKDLKGKSTAEGLKKVREVERQLNQTRRGRKPKFTPIARDAHSRLDMLYYMTMGRLRKAPTDAAAKAHLEVVLIMQGEREVLELYEGNGKAAKKMVKPKDVKERISLLETEEKRVKEMEAKKASKKKTTKKKATKAKAPARKKATKKKATKAKATKKKAPAKKKTAARKKAPTKKVLKK